MSDVNYYDEDDQMDTEPRQNPVRAALKKKEKELEEVRQQLAEAEQAKRELAFVKAGVDPADPKFKYFVKAYDGEFNPDSIRQAAIEAQLMSPPEQVAPDEQLSWQRTNAVAAGSQTAQPPIDWVRRLNEASSEAEVMALLAEAQQTN